MPFIFYFSQQLNRKESECNRCNLKIRCFAFYAHLPYEKGLSFISSYDFIRLQRVNTWICTVRNTRRSVYKPYEYRTYNEIQTSTAFTWKMSKWQTKQNNGFLNYTDCKYFIECFRYCAMIGNCSCSLQNDFLTATDVNCVTTV